ncbi:MAG: YraN family protein [Calditrichaceae bacterium]
MNLNRQTERQKLGAKGERLAENFLISKGHRILFRNYRHGKSELDLISRTDEVIVISEVKSFYADPLGAAEFRIHKHKQRKMIQGAYGFLSKHPEFDGLGVRFDVLIVDFSEYPARITHYEGAFYDEEGY